jgi:phage-related protein
MANVVEVSVRARDETRIGFAASAKSAKEEGQKAGKAFSSAFSGILGVVGVAGIGLAFKNVITEGAKLQKSTDLLVASERSKGIATATTNRAVAEAVRIGEKYGQTQNVVQDAIRKFVGQGASLKLSISAATAAMKISTATGQDYNTVIKQMSMNNDTGARFMKNLGVAQIAGKDSAAALASAQAFLSDRIKNVGGMAKYAAVNHMSLKQVQELVNQASQGNITAFNKLGIEVIPRTNTATQNLAQAATILNSKFSTSSQVAAASFSGQLAHLKAVLQDASAQIGQKFIPALTAMLGFVARNANVLIPLIAGIAGLMVASKVASSIQSLAVAFKALWVIMAANPYVLIAAAIIAAILLIIKYHHQIWDFIKKVWNDIFQFLHRLWDSIYAFAKQWWPLIFGTAGLIYKYHNEIWRFIQYIWNAIFGFFKRIWGDILGFFRGTTASAERLFSNAWNSMFNTIRSVWNNVVSFFRGLPGRIVGALGNAGSLLVNWGRGVINGILSGMTSVINSVWNFIKGIPGQIMSFLGIKSPPQWAIDAGKHIMNGIGIGLDKAKGVLSKATATIKSAVTGAGEGVTRWIPLIIQALKMEGLDPSLLRNVLIQMQSESGGNPRAVNLWDSNAARGDPSMGLMQTIGSTFRAYHWPGTSWDIFDPLANIAAALNYARHVYGPSLMRGGMGIGSGSGYGAGGIGGGWATVGEYGRELVRLPFGSQVYPHSQSFPAGAGGGRLVLEIRSGGNSTFEQFMLEMFRRFVVVHGGGDVQVAFGRR